MVHGVYIPVFVIANLLGGCGPTSISRTSGTPVVRAQDGASASITVITCAPTESRAAGVGDIIQFLLGQDELVIASTGGSARLTINACPGGTPAPTPVRR